MEKIETKEDLEAFAKNNYGEYKNLMGKRENLWKRYHKVKIEEDKSKILVEINSIQPSIKELRKLKNYCNNIEQRSKIIQNNLNKFDKDLNKEKDKSRYL